MSPLIYKTARRRRVALLVVLAASGLALPRTASAQQGAAGGGIWRVEPELGVWHQVDRGPATAERTGIFAGVRLSRERGGSARLTASAGYHRLNNALEQVVPSPPPGPPRTDVRDAEIVSVTAGITGDVWQGAVAAVSAGFEVGPGWNRDRLARSTDPAAAAADPPDAWELVLLAAPSLAVRRAMGPRMELSATGRILFGVGDISPETVPTLAAGVAYRF